MATVTAPPATGQEQDASAEQRRDALRWPEGYVAMRAAIVGAFALTLVFILPLEFNQDSWLTVLAGHIVASGGIPHHVTLTLMAAGRPWRDQQWLAQLIMYGIDQIGGLPLLALFQATITVAALWGATVAAIRLGALPRGVLAVLPVAAFCLILAPVVRAQSYGYPLFVLVVWLLASDSRTPSRRVLWVIPALVLWANLHGAVTLAVALCVLRGLLIVCESRGSVWCSRLHRERALGLIVGAPLCLLVTPYGLSIISYYHATLDNPAFRQLISEWRPVTASAWAAVPAFALSGVAVWSFGLWPRATTLWEKLALLVLIVAAITGLRNIVWLALGAAILLPLTVTPGVRPRAVPLRPRRLLDRTLVVAVVAGLLLSVVHVVSDWRSVLGGHYPTAALPVIRAAARDPAVRVYADERYADWLMWELPRLRGRVAYDTSFELLTNAQLDDIASLKSISGLSWRRTLDGYGVLALDESEEPELVSALERSPGVRVLFDRYGLVVLSRPPDGSIDD